MKRLPEEEQLVLSLYYCDGMNVREIGGIKGMKPASVSRLFKRAMLDLLSRVKE
ncbi:MAG: sigma factor-like helix-turn-helix DNA-binding protein [Acidobacteriota bacterium]